MLRDDFGADRGGDFTDRHGVFEGTLAAVGESDVDHGFFLEFSGNKKGRQASFRGCRGTWLRYRWRMVVLMSHTARRFPGVSLALLVLEK
jgi:hypothetical protein